MKNIVNRTVGATLRIGLIVAKRIGYPVAPYVPLFVVMLWVRVKMNAVWRKMLGSNVWEIYSSARDGAHEMIEKSGWYVRQKVGYTYLLIKSDRPKIFAMVGLPQTGKSTIAKAFAEVMGAIVVENNAIRDHLFHYNVSQFPLLNFLAFCMAKKGIEAGYDVVLDSDFASPAKRRMLEALALELRAEVQYIYVQCDKATWLARVRSDTHKFGPIYHNAVASQAAELLPTVSQTYDPKRRLLIDCVIGEYERQEIEHEYVDFPSKISFYGNVSQGVLKESARALAYRILASYGASGAIKAHYQNLLNKYANLW